MYTTLDLDMQKAAYEAVTTTLNQEGDPAGSLVAIDDQGQVKAMMGGTDFANSQLNLATGKAGGGLGRQPGSTFKMFALADAVKEGYSVRSVLPSPSSDRHPARPVPQRRQGVERPRRARRAHCRWCRPPRTPPTPSTPS